MKKIKFEKAICPFGSDIEQNELPKIKHTSEEGDEEEFDVGEVMDHQRPVKMIATELGMFPLTEHTSPSKIFNMWVGHTNFPLTANMCKDISKVRGVEIYMTLSPYRFKIGIAKLFEEQDVMENIKQMLLEDDYDVLRTLRD